MIRATSVGENRWNGPPAHLNLPPMLRSMTGFGRAEGPVGGMKVSVELRSLNSKQLDLQVKLPQAWRDKEMELRQWAGGRVQRGKADLWIGGEAAKRDGRTAVDAELLRHYHARLREAVLAVDPSATTDLMAVALRMPEVLGEAKDEPAPEQWPAVLALVEAAGAAFEEFRRTEGAKLESELKDRVGNILRLLAETETMDTERLPRMRVRLQARLEEWQTKVDRDRLEQELVYYMEKLDVTEEKVRLAAHGEYFLRTMDQEEGQGRKLGFIAQEMGREINTLGSKSNDAAMQRHVVLMKDELEKIKEQTLNVL
jgi:uncharacterized protein (TIGR00255 family)